MGVPLLDLYAAQVVQRLLPKAATLHVYVSDGRVQGLALSDDGQPLPWPDDEAIAAAWSALQAELPHEPLDPSPLPLASLVPSEGQALEMARRIAALEQRIAVLEAKLSSNAIGDDRRV